MSKLHLDLAAEKEADDIGRKFMNSTDVVGDMSRAYGADLSSVKIHTDDNAASQAADRGVDAFSTGKDVFFARNVFNQSDPDSRGILAHELAHSLQQGVGGDMGGMGESVQQSAPAGAPQGLFGWFRNRKRRKAMAGMEISEPQLLTGEYMDTDAKTDTGDSTVRSFQNSRSYALNQMLQNASPEQLKDPRLRQLVIDDYNTNMNARLQSLEGSSKDEMDSKAFRRGAGELHSLNILLGSMMPDDFSQQVMSAQKQGGEDAALDFISDSVSGNEELMGVLGSLNDSFEGVSNYADPEARSAMMMNNLVLRSVNGVIGRNFGLAQRARADELKAQGKTNDEIEADIARTVDKSDVIRSMKLQKSVNTGQSKSAGRLRGLLAELFRKKKD